MSELKKVFPLTLIIWALSLGSLWSQLPEGPPVNWTDNHPLIMKSFASTYYMRSTLNWQELPPNIPFVSNKFIPGNLDLGSRYVEERFGHLEYASFNLKLDRVDSVSTAGTLRQFQWLQIYELFLDINELNWSFHQTTPAHFLNPFHPKNANHYLFIEDSTGIVFFEPKSQKMNAAAGRIFYQDRLNYRIELFLDKKDHIRLADSIFFQMEVKNGIPIQGNLEFTIDVPFFKGLNRMEWQMIGSNETFISPNGPCLQEWPNAFDSLRLKNRWRPIPLDSAQQFTLDEQAYFNAVKPDERSKLIQKVIWLQPLITSTRIAPSPSNYINFPALWNGFGVNTVEGGYYVFRPEWRTKTRLGEIQLRTDFRYAFNENRFRWMTRFRYQSLSKTRKFFEVKGGRYVRQFNELDPISSFYNSFYTVFTGDNFLKMFEQDFVRLKFEFEPILGFRISSFIEYSERTPLFNLPQYTDQRNYTPNNPDYETVISPVNGFNPHQANTFGLELSYQVRQRYQIQRNKRIDIQSNWPKFYVDYKMGVELLNGNTDFDFAGFGFTDKTDWGRWGLTEMDISIGSFFNSEHVEFPDFHHFNGIQNLFLQPATDTWSNIRQFSTLPYYDYSTSNNYLEVHIKHNFRTPFITNLFYNSVMNWSTYIGWSFLHTSEKFDYSEYYIGIEDIFEILSIQFVYPSPQISNSRSSSIRIGITIDHSYYRDFHR